MIYGVIDTVSGQTRITQAGHPNPIFLKKGGGEVTFIGSGGFPVGMLPDVDYEEHQISLNRGDRLVLYSDGITECINKNEEQFSEERLMKLLIEGMDLPLQELKDKIEQSLRHWKEGNDFEDDVTLLAMEMV